jgi:hypothetical protein
MNKTIYSYTACRCNSLFLINTTSKWYNAYRWFRTDLGRNPSYGVWILVMNKAVRVMETSYCFIISNVFRRKQTDTHANPSLRPFLKRLRCLKLQGKCNTHCFRQSYYNIVTFISWRKACFEESADETILYNYKGNQLCTYEVWGSHCFSRYGAMKAEFCQHGTGPMCPVNSEHFIFDWTTVYCWQSLLERSLLFQMNYGIPALKWTTNYHSTQRDIQEGSILPL